MPRIARIVAVGLPHHITQRGNYKQKVFLDDNDKKRYLSWIQEYTHKFGLSVLAFCLMPNHVHFIVIPNKEESLAKTFNVAHMRYSQYFNKKIQAKGHLWQGRFYSCVLDEPHLILAAKYIERNPVRANIVKKPWQWKWSSASAHINKEKSLINLNDLFKIVEMSPETWRQYIDSKEEEMVLNEIRMRTRTGRPWGEVGFIEGLERKFSKRLLALPRGRPKKEQ